MTKVRTYARAISIPVILGALVGIITSGFMDYEELQRPILAPPSWLFPIVWTILYTLMGVSYGRLESNGKLTPEAKAIYYAQLITNLIWPVFFFVFEWRLFSFLWIILLLFLVVKMIMIFYKEDKLAGLLQIPYLIWLIFATYLNLATYLLNR